MASTNPLRARWATGGTTLGGWLIGGDPVLAETLAAAGFDEVCIDLQHSGLGSGDLVGLCQAILLGGSVPTVRLASHDPAIVGKALDVGAAGVIAPMVETAAEAAAIAAACRYPPRGLRSAGSVRAYLNLGSDAPEVLEDVACVVMVETARGLENVEAIAATPGIDVVYVGPADLALGLGLPPAARRTAADHARFDAAIDRILAACAGAGVVAGFHCGNGAQARRMADRGFRMLTVTSDLGLVIDGAAAELAAARGATAASPPPSAAI